MMFCTLERPSGLVTIARLCSLSAPCRWVWCTGRPGRTAQWIEADAGVVQGLGKGGPDIEIDVVGTGGVGQVPDLQPKVISVKNITRE